MNAVSDINLKFAIVSCLNELGLYIDEADEIKMNAFDDPDFDELGYDDIVPQVYDYYKNLQIKPEDIEKITTFDATASSECYNFLVKEWSGEDDIFDITSLNGIEQLSNLEIFKPFGLLEYDVNIEALLLCKKLKTIHTQFIPDTTENKIILDEFRNRGGEVI
jgi:hypothetical protein